MSLSFEERKKTILEQLERDEKVQVISLAEQLNVSTETIRRDLDRLENEGKLKKVYGGAIKTRLEAWEPPFIQRTGTNRKEKSAIGKLAASLVKSGETIMIGNGTTGLEVIRHLSGRDDVMIVTHFIPAMLLAMEMFKGKIIFAGGEVNMTRQSATGVLAEAALKQFKVNKAFISAGGISLVDGITDYDLNEASISRTMIERAEEAIILADHSKLGKTTFAKIAEIHEASIIITDNKCPETWVNQLRQKGIDLLIADQEGSE